LKTLLTLMILLLTFSLAGAEMYQWVDEHGVTTFKDTPPPPSKKHKKVKVYDDSDFAPAPASQPVKTSRSDKNPAVPAPQAPATKKERFTGTVEIYVTDWCGYCKKALNYLERNDIPHVAYNIEKDSAAKQRHKELGGRGVPLIIIGTNKVSGFSPESIEYYLSNGR